MPFKLSDLYPGGKGVQVWAPSTDYLANDLVSIDKIIYRVTEDHTSAATFDDPTNRLVLVTADNDSYLVNAAGLGVYQINVPHKNVIITTDVASFVVDLPLVANGQTIDISINATVADVEVNFSFNATPIPNSMGPNGTDVPFVVSNGQLRTFTATCQLTMGGGPNWTVVPHAEVFQAATPTRFGTAGYVPMPSPGDQRRYLKGDSTWGEAGVPSVWQPLTEYVQNELVTHEGMLFKAFSNHTSPATFNEIASQFVAASADNYSLDLNVTGQTVHPIESPATLISLNNIDQPAFIVKAPSIENGQVIDLQLRVTVDSVISFETFAGVPVLAQTGVNRLTYATHPLAAGSVLSVKLINFNLGAGTTSWLVAPSDYNPFMGASVTHPGSAGFVPRPQIADTDRFLKGDGTWSSAGGIRNWVSNTSYTNNELILLDSIVYRAYQDFTSGATPLDSKRVAISADRSALQLSTPASPYVVPAPYSLISLVNISTPTLDIVLPEGNGQSLDFFLQSAGTTVVRFLNPLTLSPVSNNLATQGDVLSSLNLVAGQRKYYRLQNLKVNPSVSLWTITPSTFAPFTGATVSTEGSSGTVPTPLTTDLGKFLSANGNWETVSSDQRVPISLQDQAASQVLELYKYKLVDSTVNPVSAGIPVGTYQPGDWFGVIDVKGFSNINNITIGPATFESINQSYTMNTRFSVVKILYIDATIGFILIQER